MDKSIALNESTILELFKKMSELERLAGTTTYDGRNYCEQSEGAYAMLQILGLNIDYIRWEHARYLQERANNG